MTEDEYCEEVRADIMSYLDSKYCRRRIKRKERGDLYDELFVEDSVTGNGSGSYTFSNAEAEKNVAGSIQLLGEAMDEFCSGPDLLKKGAEACDVAIRCYLLGQLLDDCICRHNEENGK